MNLAPTPNGWLTHPLQIDVPSGRMPMILRSASADDGAGLDAVAVGAVAVLFVMVAVAVGLGAIVGSLAASKGRDRARWWIFGTVLFIPALIAVAVVRPDTRGMQRQWARSGGVLCRDCRQPLNDGATRCHHCGTGQRVDGSNRPDAESAEFFVHQFSSVTANRHLVREIGILLNVNLVGAEVENDRIAERCLSVIDNAVAEVPDDAFVEFDGMALPEEWVAPYQRLSEQVPPRKLVGYLRIACAMDHESNETATESCPGSP